MHYIFMTVAFAVGLLIPFQAIINAKLSTELQSPYAAALISFTGGFLCFLLLTLFNASALQSLTKVTGINPVLMTGGIIGAIFIISAIFLVPRLGSTAWVGLLVTGQMLMSLVLDHYGVLGLPQHSLSTTRIIGAAMLIGGATLISLF